MPAQAPAIIVEDVVLAPSKRRRLERGTSEKEGTSLAGTKSSNPSPPVISREPQSVCRQICDDTIVCFGMVIDRPVIALSGTTTAPSCSHETVFFTPDRCLRRCISRDLVGRLDDHASEVLCRITSDRELILQLVFSAFPLAFELDNKPPKGTVGFLGVIIYGPRHRSIDVGHFMTQCGYYLEDPACCDRNVPYLNPQCLFNFHENPIMTFDLPQIEQQSVHDFARTPSDILAGFVTTAQVPEAVTPSALRTNLKTHQRQALTFFMRREQGLHPTEHGVGIWSQQTNTEGGNTFVNTFTNKVQSAFPPIWRGGLLADEMGLGKTLSMIALVASDQEGDIGNPPQVGHSVYAEQLRSTLIVVPLNVLAVWKLQLKTHVHTSRLTWSIHHGKSRFQLSHTAKPPDIVFTTYNIVEREQRYRGRNNNSLFSHHWKRIILDEAHIIRNHNTATARAITSLRATSRWAISGTPIQNGLTDFLGLFKFLHFHPYDDPKIFDDDISNLWRSRPVDEAIETFKKLLSGIMIRRTKAVLDLPSREDRIITLSFNYLEEKHYRQIEQPVAEMLNQAAEEETASPGKIWVNAIQQINKLRLICNLGTFVPSDQLEPTHSRGSDRTLAVLAARLSMGGEACEQCLQPFDSLPSETELDDSPSSTIYYSICHRLFCTSCSILSRYQAPEPCACVNQPNSCPLRPLLPLLPAPILTPTGDACSSRMEMDDTGQISSKVRAVLSEIRMHLGEKNVVFSSWTTSLDMVQRALKCNGIGFVRIDGKVATKKREEAIKQFHDDPKILVILITISCGACGLDLTAASRVHLLEPQWNPYLEEQALARAHRIGQKNPVTTLRYVMRNSFEEHILKVQDRKKLLATALLSDGSSIELSNQITDPNNAFQKLRQLLNGE